MDRGDDGLPLSHPPKTLEEAKARLLEAMGPKVPADAPWWFDEVLRRIWAHRGLVERHRTYDISTPGARIRTAREIAGWTQRQLAARAGKAYHQTLGAIERGEMDCPAAYFEKLCRVLRVSPAWVLGESEEGGPPCPEHAVMRRQFYPDWLRESRDYKDRVKAKAELERLRGLRPPKAGLPKDGPERAADGQDAGT